MHPDIIIINLPHSCILSDEDIKNIETTLCKNKKCPQIFINYALPKHHKPQIHQWNFKTENLSYEQIMDIVEYTKTNHQKNILN